MQAMYLKRVDGPRMVTLDNGKSMSRADLPDPKTRRWVASRKALVTRAVENGLISKEEACEMYALSEEELDHWCMAFKSFGEKALKTTRLQDYRQLDAN